MKKVLTSFILLAIVAVLPACKKSSSSPATASVMFVHGCAAGATNISLDGRIDNVAVSGAVNIQFRQSSGYRQTLPVTGSTLSFFVTGLNILASTPVTFAANSHYTAFASGSITAPGILITTDDLATPASGMAKIRFVNLSPDGLITSCYYGTTKLDSNIGYKTATPFYEVAAGSVKIGMVDQTILTNAGLINSQVLSAGKIYTFMLTGSATGSGSSIITLTAISNN